MPPSASFTVFPVFFAPAGTTVVRGAVVGGAVAVSGGVVVTATVAVAVSAAAASAASSCFNRLHATVKKSGEMHAAANTVRKARFARFMRRTLHDAAGFPSRTFP